MLTTLAKLAIVPIVSSIPHTTLEAKINPLIDIPYQNTLDLQEDYFCKGFETYEELKKGAESFAKNSQSLKYEDILLSEEVFEVSGFAILPRKGDYIFSAEDEGLGFGISSKKHIYFIEQISPNTYGYTKIKDVNIDTLCNMFEQPSANTNN
jgi:hypothetical protein